MGISTQQITSTRTLRRSSSAGAGKCLSCGSQLPRRGCRYCSKECRQHLAWVLSLSKGLLRTFNTRYAAFSFTDDHVILDVLSVWSKVISRFVYQRTNGRRPAEDLKRLILKSGKEWHNLVDNRNSRSFASLSLLEKCLKKDLDPDSIKPNKNARPRLSKIESDCLKILKLGREDLSSADSLDKIKQAYKKLAKIHHPDMGGDEERFKKLNQAHEKMLLWTQNPQYTSRKALNDCWSFDGFNGKWSPPL